VYFGGFGDTDENFLLSIQKYYRVEGIGEFAKLSYATRLPRRSGSEGV